MSLILIIAFPLLGFFLNAVLYIIQTIFGLKKSSAVFTGVLSSVVLFFSFLIAVFQLIRIFNMPIEARVIEEYFYTWFSLDFFHLDVLFRFDVLSSLFTVVITGVGTLIHVYSIGYMSHDKTPGKFFCYLNLFCFSMLLLVLSSSLPVLFLGWEGVGLCSYLLIGYWYQDEEKAKAGKKAFVVNRIGDAGFLIGMFILFLHYGTLDFSSLKEAVHLKPDVQVATIAGLFFFLACMGKSAQIPLYVWLPDAMAGPTPVSALIHAATMVTSGIYLVSRLSFLYSIAPVTLQVMAIIGAFTALFAAAIAVVQSDIKKILAYSTISQLGYMFLGCGVGAYSAGIFHVITHAFFKALLFLGAGSVIHGMNEEQDIWKMGGLRTKMPKTFLVFLVGWLAICGIPPFAGFFSKDEILWSVFSSQSGSFVLWLIGFLTAILTSFYMTRLFSLVFLGQSRSVKDHVVHESTLLMILPLQILALLSILSGFIGIPHLSWIEHWLDPALDLPVLAVSHPMPPALGLEWVLMALSTLGAVFGVWVSLFRYRHFNQVKNFSKIFSPFYVFFLKKGYIDELYEWAFVHPIRWFSEKLWRELDVAVIDGIVIFFGQLPQFIGKRIRVLQNGSIHVYALVLIIGLTLCMGYLVYAKI